MGKTPKLNPEELLGELRGLIWRERRESPSDEAKALLSKVEALVKRATGKVPAAKGRRRRGLGWSSGSSRSDLSPGFGESED